MKKQMIFGALTLALLACSDSEHAGGSITDVNTLASDDSSSSVEVESSSSVENQSSSSDLPFVPEESSSSVVESSSSSVLENRYPHGINPLEGTASGHIMDASDIVKDTLGDFNELVSGSKTTYYFKSERTSFYCEWNPDISIYEEEQGIFVLASTHGGVYWSTSRMVESPEDNKPYIINLLANGYWDKEKCISDLQNYKEWCASLQGDFVNYGTECQGSNLDLSCVYPNNLDGASVGKNLEILAEQEKNYLEEFWINVTDNREVSDSRTSSSSYFEGVSSSLVSFED